MANKEQTKLMDGLKKATTEMMVLFMLRKQPMYTYEIMKAIEQVSNHVLVYNTLYIAINRLCKNGLIEEASKSLTDDNHVRIYYKITDAGIRYLDYAIQEYHRISAAIERVISS